MSRQISPFIPLSIPEIRGNEWKYVRECLDTGWVSSVGPFVTRFEKQVADYVGTRHGVATVNGTAALHVSLLVAGIEPDDEVLVSTLTFIAPVNAIRYAGAWPVFIDAEPRYGQMDIDRVAQFLEHQCQWKRGVLRNRKTGRRVRAILPVHVLGHPVDMTPLLKLARKFKLAVIEDATEGLGAEYRGKKIGGIGHIGCFSFNGNKILTTGGGGMIVTNNARWAERAKHLTTQAKSDPDEYIHDQIGYNYRLTNLQAAMGCAQMEQLDSYVSKKRAIAMRYNQALSSCEGFEVMEEASWAKSVFWMYTIRINPRLSRRSSREWMRFLATRKIQTRPLWQPIHQSPAHRFGSPLSCPAAEKLYRNSLSLPCSVGLTREAQNRVIQQFC